MEDKNKYKYYLDDNNGVYAKDEAGNEFAVMAKGMVPVEAGTIDIMWSSLAEDQVDSMVKEYEKFLDELRARAKARKEDK